jgi:hypothetical protein
MTVSECQSCFYIQSSQHKTCLCCGSSKMKEKPPEWERSEVVSAPEPTRVECPYCHGEGGFDGTDGGSCEDCDGEGTVESVDGGARRDQPWIIWFEDASMNPEVFSGVGAEAAAKARYGQLNVNWNVHLLTEFAGAMDGGARELEQIARDAAKRCYGMAQSPGISPLEDEFTEVIFEALRLAMERKAGR